MKTPKRMMGVLIPVAVAAAMLIQACARQSAERAEHETARTQPETQPADESSPRTQADAEHGGWSIDFRPGQGDATALRLTGTVTMPSPGFEVALKKEDTQHLPNTLLLYVESRKLEGFWAQVLTDMNVSYTDPDFTGEYDHIVIYMPDSQIVCLKLNGFERREGS